MASCLDFSGRRNKVVYTDLNFPSVMYFWEAQRARGARVEMVPQRRRHSRQHRAPAGCHRRRDADRAHFARHLPQRLHSGRRGHRREGAPRRRLRPAGFLSGDRHAAFRRAKAQRRFLHRRSAQVAVRRAGNGVPLRASRPGEETGAQHSLDGSVTRTRSRFEIGPNRYSPIHLSLHARGRPTFPRCTPRGRA